MLNVKNVHIDLKDEYEKIMTYVKSKWILSNDYTQRLTLLWNDGIERFKNDIFFDESEDMSVEKLRALANNATYPVIKKFIESYFPKGDHFNDALPVGFHEKKVEYEKCDNEYEMMDLYKKNQLKDDIKAFKGAIIELSIQRQFCLNVSLENVLYDYVEQGNKPYMVLTESIIYHLIDCIKHNNYLQ